LICRPHDWFINDMCNVLSPLIRKIVITNIAQSDKAWKASFFYAICHCCYINIAMRLYDQLLRIPT
ncbi:hypothetical protein ACWTQ4_004408, partial [Yersinia enterocolitica]